MKNKEIKIEKTLMSMNVTVDDEINSNKFKKTKRSTTFKRHEHAKQTRKKDAQAQCLLILFYSSNHNISKFRSRFNEQDLKNFEKLISN